MWLTNACDARGHADPSISLDTFDFRVMVITHHDAFEPGKSFSLAPSKFQRLCQRLDAQVRQRGNRESVVLSIVRRCTGRRHVSGDVGGAIGHGARVVVQLLRGEGKIQRGKEMIAAAKRRGER